MLRDSKGKNPKIVIKTTTKLSVPYSVFYYKKEIGSKLNVQQHKWLRNYSIFIEYNIVEPKMVFIKAVHLHQKSKV